MEISAMIVVNTAKIGIQETENYLYFRDLMKKNPKPQAIWHKAEKRWIKCHCEFGDNFKAQIKSVLGL